MKRIKQAMSLLLAAPMVCAVLAGSALAAKENTLWLQLEQSSGAVTAVVETNTVVTDGAIQVNFDPDKLTYVSCDFVGAQEQYKTHVAMHAVNDSKAAQGEVRISWVAPQAGTFQGNTEALFHVNFKAKQEGASAGTLKVSGTANTAEGKAVEVLAAATEKPVQPTPPPAVTPKPTEKPTPQPSQTPAPEATQPPSQAPTAQPSQKPAAPAGDNQNGSGNSDSQQHRPATGDHANLILYLGLSLVCVAGLGLAVVVKNQRRGER